MYNFRWRSKSKFLPVSQSAAGSVTIRLSVNVKICSQHIGPNYKLNWIRVPNTCISNFHLCCAVPQGELTRAENQLLTMHVLAEYAVVRFYKTVRRPSAVCPIIRQQPRRGRRVCWWSSCGREMGQPAAAPQHGTQQQMRAVSHLQLT